MVLGAALSGCGGDAESESVDPIEISTSQVQTGAPIDLDRKVDPDTGAFVAEEWPSACALVDESTITSLFPQAEDVRQQPRSQDLTFLSIAPESGPPSTDVTVPEAECSTSVGFPQPGLGLDDGNLVVQVDSRVVVAGTEKLVERNASSAMNGGKSAVAGGACVHEPPLTYHCDVGSMIFSVSLDMRQSAQYTRAESSDYVVDGEEHSFRGFDATWQAIVHDNVLVPVVEAAVSRAGGSS